MAITPWTAEQILALAPDGQVAKAAPSLARPGKWQRLGWDAQACWGECAGSGAASYRVAVAFDGPAFQCGCPSHKHPCKHAVGLLLLAQADPDALSEARQPEWVQAWLAGRAAQGAKKALKPAKSATDPKAQARRAAQREKRVRQGMDALSLWLQDLLLRGLGSLQGAPPGFWETQAARLVDAQAPGLARQVREIAALSTTGTGWHDRMLRRMARLHLLLEAFSRLDGLPPDVQEEVRSLIGWTQDRRDLLHQPGERDCWQVVGLRTIQEERLLVQRTWLWGVDKQRAALILTYAPLGQSLETDLVPGSSLDAELVFWPGSYPMRALIKDRHATHPMERLPGYPNLLAALDGYGGAIARNPWVELFLMPLEQVVPIRQGEGWAVRDGRDTLLPLAIPPSDGWRLLALSGGHPITLVGEWNGESIDPLSVWVEGELVPIGGAL